MKNSAIDILKTFTAGETVQFKLFVSSDYFNKNTKVKKLCEILLKYHPDYSSKSLKKENLFVKIYGHGRYSDVDLRSLFFQLSHLAQKFIAVQSLDKNEFYKSNIILDEFLRRDLVQPFEKVRKKTQDYVTNKLVIDREMLLELYKYERNLFNFADSYEYIKKSNAAVQQIDTLINSNEYLLLHFIRNSVTCFIYGTVQGKNYDIDKSFVLTEQILSSINFEFLRNHFKKHHRLGFLLELYYYSFQMFQQPLNHELYLKFDELLRKFKKKLGKQEISFFHCNCINYCIMQKNYGQNKAYFNERLLTLFDEYLEHEMYLNSDEIFKHLPISLFMAMVAVGLSNMKIEWVKKIIERYSAELPLKEAENMRHFAFAQLYEKTERFEDALYHANKVKFSYPYLKYLQRELTVRVFVELDYVEEVISILNSFKAFLENEKLMNDSYRSSGKRFIYFVEKLVRSKYGPKGEDLEELLIQLNNEVNLLSKNWLIRKYKDEMNKL